MRPHNNKLKIFLGGMYVASSGKYVYLVKNVVFFIRKVSSSGDREQGCGVNGFLVTLTPAYEYRLVDAPLNPNKQTI